MHRIIVVDDHTVTRKWIVRLLQEMPGLEVIGSAANGVQAIALTRRLLPDIVVMDINMPEMNGVEATRRITDDLPGVQIIGLSVDEDSGPQMMAAGAASYISKGSPTDELLTTIYQLSDTRPSSH